MKTKKLLIAIAGLAVMQLHAQEINPKGVFRDHEPGYYRNTIMKEINEKKNTGGKTDKVFGVDLTGENLPNKLNLYDHIWHNGSISQGNTGTCWCYSTVSFLESDLFRMRQRQVKLSEMYVVYWEYVEKATAFIESRGQTYFPQGSEANAVTRMIKKYGIVPLVSYDPLPAGKRFHHHDPMYDEMKGYLKSVKEQNAWHPAQNIQTIKAILDHYMGAPPTAFNHEGRQITPQQYLTEVLKMNMDDYVEILSYKQQPYWEQVEYEVPDNWWHSADYYNVPLQDFMDALKNAVKKGYGVSIGGDVSEPGFDRETQCAVVPAFDIPSAYIDEDARQFRFSNKTTTDDHGMHVVGITEAPSGTWYLVKDSGSGSRNNDVAADEFGYYFFHEDYVKLKMMDFTVHKDAVNDLLKKFK